MVAKNFENLVNELLRSSSPKKWFRAYFNHGLINYIYGQKRLLPCDMSFDTFFIDPYGDVMPCNGTKDKEVMGNLNNQTWDELWNSPEAEKVRAKVRCCDRDCWMIGSVSPAMHKYIWKPATWVLVHKFKALFTKHPYSMALVRMIYGDSGWDKKMSYRLLGRAFPQQRLVSFKITDAMQIENGRVLTENVNLTSVGSRIISCP